MTVAESIQSQKAVATATILKRCVCLVLACSALGNSRKVDLSDIVLTEKGGDDVGADKREVSASKLLLDRKVLSQATHVIEAAKSYLRSIATQGVRVFGPGTYLVPITLVLEAEDRLRQFKADLTIAVDALVAQYPEAVAARRKALGHLFHERDYLTSDEVQAEFTIDWSYVSFTAPEQLEEVDQVVFEAAKAKHEQKLASAAEEVVVQLRATALRVMRELAERLAPGPDGKPKALRGTALRDLQDFIAVLPRRDVLGDDELTAVVARVAGYADGLDVGMLKSAPGVRAGLAREAAAASKALEGLVATAAGRAISFGPIAAESAA